MKKLKDVASIIRSKNAGPFDLTFEIFFRSPETYREVKAKQAVNTKRIARLYSLREDKVRLYFCDSVNAIKITIPRLHSAGSASDTDVFGAQQHGPLLSIEIRE